MSQRFIDSFDHYNDIFEKWTATVNAGTGFTPNGRHGSGYQLGSGLVSAGVSKTIDYQGTWIVGWAFKIITSVGTPNSTIYSLASGGAPICNLNINTDSTLSVETGGNNITYGYTSVPLNEDTWYYIEIKNVMTGSWGVQTWLRLNGQTLLNGVTGTCIPIGFINPNQAVANRHYFGSPGSATNGCVIDDLYINDGTGTLNNDFNGDCEIGVIVMNGDSSTTWNQYPNSGSHFQKINEIPPDNDTTYIYSTVLNNIDLFTPQQILSFLGTVHGVQISILARKDDEGYRAITPVIGSIADSKYAYLNDSYKYYVYNYDQDPNGPTDWSVAQFNGETFGVKVTV